MSVVIDVIGSAEDLQKEYFELVRIIDKRETPEKLLKKLNLKLTEAKKENDEYMDRISATDKKL